MKIRLLLIFMVVSSLACSYFEKIDDTREIPYFNLKEYIDTEVNSLKKARPTLRKIAILNGKKDELVTDSADYKQFLQPLADCDIHKPNLIGSYGIDSVKTTDSLIVRYKAISDNLALKTLQLNYHNGRLSSIHAVKSGGGFFSQNSQDITYISSQKLRILKKYKTIFTKETIIEVIGYIE